MSMICAVVALLVQTVLFQETSSKLIYSQAKNESYNSLRNMQNELESFCRGIESNMVLIYNDTEFLRDLAESEDTDYLRDKYYSRAEELATDRFEISEGVLALYIYNEDHEIISNYRKFSTPKHHYPKDIYAEEGDYNIERVKNYAESDVNTMLISGYYNSALNRDIIRFAIKLHRINRLGDKIGYVLCDVDSKSIRKIMNKYNISYNTYTWLQPLGDIPVCVTEDKNGASREYFLELCKYIESGDRSEIESGYGKSNELFYVDQERFNLTAYSLAPQSLLMQNQRMLTRNLILIAIVTISVLALLFFYLTKTLTEPLESLSDTVTRIGKGETELRVLHTAEDEIGKLGFEFNHMLDEVEALIRKQYENELLLNKAEYKALQAQINPHFLYNTLDTMSSIASIQDCEIVSSLCQSLSGIFRYSLDMKHPYSTVAKELNHLKNYIFVMNVRMTDKIRYHYDIDDEVLQDSIPRISLQPLVENAISHGLKNKHGDKDIWISAKNDDGRLCINVRDNGVGMDEDSINKRLNENDSSTADNGRSIGLYNINARMKLLDGDEYGVLVESNMGEGAEVKIVIPERRLDEII